MRRALWLGAGLACVALGAVGAVLPIVPTVPFLIAAAFCFSRGHPDLAERLHRHPRYGPPLRDWRDRRAIGRRAKLAAIGAMVLGVGFTALTVGFPLAFISVAVLAIFGPWIWTRAE